MDIEDVTILSVIPDGRLVVDPGLNFVDQQAVQSIIQKETERKQKDKEANKVKRKSRFSSIGKMFGKNKDKNTQRTFNAKAEALKSYAAEREDELDFEKGEVLLVDLASVAEAGWYFAQYKGKMGLVPASFVKITTGIEGIAEEGRLESTSAGSLQGVQEGDEAPTRVLIQATCLHDFAGEGEGEIRVQRGDLVQVDAEQVSKGEPWVYTTLREASGYLPVSYFKLGVIDVDEELKKARVWVYGEVLYAYEAEKGDELSMKVGDIIMVDNNQIDPDWRMAQMNGREGFVPSEYVKIITKEEVKQKASMKLAQIRLEKRVLEEEIRKKKIKDAQALRQKKIREAELERRRKEAEERRLKEEAEVKKAEMVKKALFTRKALMGGEDQDEKEDY